MKAIRVIEFGGPEAMTLEEVPNPAPDAGQVCVTVRAVGVNPVDTYIRSGTYHIKPPLPYTPGKDGAGVVETVGDGVSDIRVGDRVYMAGSITGAYAEKALCEQNQVYPLAGHLSFAQGAGVHVPYAAAYHALFHRAGARPGQTVLVHGATGGVGLAAVQLARAHGLGVIASGGSPEGAALLREQGVSQVIDHTRDGYRDDIMALTNGRGVDVILEMLANVNLGTDLPLLAMNGCVVVIGSRGPVEINPRDAMQRNASIRGMILTNCTPDETAEIHSALVAGLENRTLNPVVGMEFPLSEAAEAHRRVLESKAYGKIVLIP